MDPTETQTQSPPVKPGDLLDGKYRIEELLGEGSFAWVFRAQHERVESLQVAVKLLKSEYLEESDTVRRFHREAQTAAALKNRHTIRVTDFGVTDDAVPFLVMELVDGSTLSDLLRRRGRLQDVDVARFAVQVLKALQEAHGAGIVHRDLKPDNIAVVNEPGEDLPIARVLDFGIAKVMDNAKGVLKSAEETAAGMLFCTPRYASPELLRGRPGPQSDLYALGITMVELLDGEAPYRGKDFYSVAAKHVAPDPVPLGRFSSQSTMASVIERAVAKKLDERFESAEQMRRAIEPILRELETAPIGVTPPLGDDAPSERSVVPTDEFSPLASETPRPADDVASVVSEVLDALDEGEADTAPATAAADSSRAAGPRASGSGESQAAIVEVAPAEDQREEQSSNRWIPIMLLLVAVGAIALILATSGTGNGDAVGAEGTNPGGETEVGESDPPPTPEPAEPAVAPELSADPEIAAPDPSTQRPAPTQTMIHTTRELGGVRGERVHRSAERLAGLLVPSTVEGPVDEPADDRSDRRDEERDDDRDDEDDEDEGSRSDDNSDNETEPNPFGDIDLMGGN